MKKINILLTISLLLLTLAGITGISLIIKDDLNTDIRIRPLPPTLSAGSGFYDHSFELSMEADPGLKIFYTLDGSLPTTNSLLYKKPITISAAGGETVVPNMTKDWLNNGYESHDNTAVILRAVAVDSGQTASDCTAATYFFDKPKEDDLIISIIADPEDLFGENGIYVTGKEYDDWYLNGMEGPMPTPNYYKRGKEWERPAVMELFLNQESFLQQPVGIRIQGASARDGAYKRFSVYARKEYSNSSWFDVNLFGEKRSHAFALRSGFMNGYIQHLMQDRDVASAESTEVYVYLNGALWYLTIAQEKFTEKYFQEHYGVDDGNLVIAKGGIVTSGDEKDQSLYQNMYDFLNTHDMSQEEAYDQLNQIMDIQSYIDFSCINVYFANLDYSENKNVICWRAREREVGPYGDTRWRWALYDMDLENLDYGVHMEDINTFTMDTHYAGSAFNTRPMYAALKQNSRFRQQFVLSFMDMVNTDFTVQRASQAMDSWRITPPSWGMKEDWVQDFFPARTKAVTGYLAEEFELTGTQEQVTLSVNDASLGHLILNTITPDLKDGSWSGSYFTDYPVTVTAEADEGRHFIRWVSGEIVLEHPDEETITVKIPEGGLHLTAVFE